MAADPSIVHIGYHRTGSSWLQANVFVPANRLEILPRPAVLEQLILPNALAFDASRARQALTTLCESHALAGGSVVVSHERLSGNPHSGGYDSALLADRVYEVFPASRILIVIREQRDLIRSVYKRYVYEGGPCSFKSYVQLPSRGRGRVPLFDFNFFEFHHLVARYQRRFGAESVLVQPFEKLAADPCAFLGTLSEFMGSDLDVTTLLNERRNASSPASTLIVKRWINRFLVRDSLNPAGWIDQPAVNRAADSMSRAASAMATRGLAERLERRLSVQVRSAVGDRYARSNSETARITGLDLAEWGYPLEDGP